jgi:hypothetical protein
MCYNNRIGVVKMNKLQAALRDRAAQSWREKKLYYRVGSYFKACCNCGEQIEVESDSGKVQVRYLSGYDVFRAYQPSDVGFTYWCYTCGAKDAKCWDGAIDIGAPAIRGSHESMHRVKAQMRKDAVGNDQPRREVTSRSAEIAKLQAELEILKNMLKEMKEN